MKLIDCFNAMQEPYRSFAFGEIDNDTLLQTECGKISDAVKTHLIDKPSLPSKVYWQSYHDTLITMSL